MTEWLKLAVLWSLGLAVWAGLIWLSRKRRDISANQVLRESVRDTVQSKADLVGVKIPGGKSNRKTYGIQGERKENLFRAR
jgi:hypothetical protein